MRRTMSRLLALHLAPLSSLRRKQGVEAVADLPIRSIEVVDLLVAGLVVLLSLLVSVLIVT